MSMRQRVESAAERAGLHSQEAIAQACGVTQPAVYALLSGSRPMQRLLDLIAEKTGVSSIWLRHGDPRDAPPWARDRRLDAFDDAQEIARRLSAMAAERDAALAEVAQLKAQLRVAKDTIADMRIEQHVGAVRPPLLAVADNALRYDSDSAVAKGFERE
jgi:transcriptional regulator with XRE-family HTH domain